MTDSNGGVPRELSFGEALAELDRIVNDLEGGQLELEESMTRYERGVALLKSLQGKLSDAQQKVTMLIGELEEDATTDSAGTAEPAGEPAVRDSSEEVPF